MLQLIRNRVGSIFAYALFAILILSFALWGTTDIFSQGGVKSVVAEVGDADITAQEIDREYQRQLNVLRRRGIDSERARMLGVLENVVARFVAATVYDQASSDLGLAVSDDQIVQDIRARFGQVGSVQFDEMLRESGYTRNEYAAMRRAEIPRLQMLESVASGVYQPKEIIANLYRWRTEERSALAFEISAKSEKLADPTNADLVKFHKENKVQFTAPEYRAVTYVHIDPKAVGKGTKIADEELRRVYKERLSDFTIAEKRTVLQILLNTKEDAEKAHDQLKKGKKFIDVAKGIAEQDEATTKFGTVAHADLPATVADNIFKLEKDKFSAPFDDAFGKRIFMVTEIIPETAQPFEKVKEHLAAEIRREQAIEDVVSLSNRLEDELGKGSSLEGAAAATGLTVHKIPAMDLGAQDKSQKAIKDLPGSPFNEAVFDAESGRDSFLTETKDGGFFILRVDAVMKSQVRPLAEVTQDVKKSWIARKRRSIARIKAEKLAKEISDGADIQAVAKKSGAKVITVGPISRSGQPKNAPAGLVAKLFALKSKNKSTFAVSGNGYMVAQLKDIKSADGALKNKVIKALRDDLKAGMVSDILAQFQD
ncbi:MAG: peptidyl-prolyl cis-trans isomerase, partial [Proteobacteria bacterium]|nr:peptidyl-prolyl cis-trans isomerase [Pseudomonadota bacterium]